MLVLGIDPGTATTGYGLVREAGGGLEAIDYGVILTEPGQPLPNRLQILYRELSSLVQRHQPSSAAVEELFFSRNTRTAMSVGQARGVILLALADAGLPIGEYTPMQVKQAVTGYGGATKAQIQDLIRMLLGLPERPHPDDAADALAIAICHVHSAHLYSLYSGEEP